MSIKNKLTLLLGIIFLFSFLNLGIVYKLEEKNKEAIAKINRTHEILLTSDKLMIALLNVETGERGFLVTKNKLYLAPYFSAVKKVDEYWNSLQGIITTGVGLGQKHLIDNLRNSINKKLAITKKSIDLGQSDPKGALVLINGNEAKRYTYTGP